MLYIEIILGCQVVHVGRRNFNKLEDLKDNKMAFYLKDAMTYLYLWSHNVGRLLSYVSP